MEVVLRAQRRHVVLHLTMDGSWFLRIRLGSASELSLPHLRRSGCATHQKTRHGREDRTMLLLLHRLLGQTKTQSSPPPGRRATMPGIRAQMDTTRPRRCAAASRAQNLRSPGCRSGRGTASSAQPGTATTSLTPTRKSLAASAAGVATPVRSDGCVAKRSTGKPAKKSMHHPTLHTRSTSPVRRNCRRSRILTNRCARSRHLRSGRNLATQFGPIGYQPTRWRPNHLHPRRRRRRARAIGPSPRAVGSHGPTKEVSWHRIADAASQRRSSGWMLARSSTCAVDSTGK
mmetsp:Transcript_4334/g.10925  ORF Transcript_4334/g.10925 Transcript_4334/m.10925 type:complete len:288 (+) Transcript_4334:98-961(+)